MWHDLIGLESSSWTGSGEGNWAKSWTGFSLIDRNLYLIVQLKL